MLTNLLATRLRNRYLFLFDAVALFFSAVLSFVVRFDGFDGAQPYERLIVLYVLLSIPLRLLLFYFMGMYRRLWRHASVSEMRQIIAVSVLGAFVSAFVGLAMIPLLGIVPGRIPFSVLFIDAFLAGSLIGLPRLLARTRAFTASKRRHGTAQKAVLIVGAGDTAKLVVKELYNSPSLGLDPIGFVDDDPAKHKHMLLDLPIFGPVSAIKDIVVSHGVAELIIAMPNAPGPVVRQVVRAGLDCGIPTLTVPSLPEIMFRSTKRPSLREVEIQDLLRRETIESDLAAAAVLAEGQTVLVTGAGGSIGSELCRQLARLAPARLVLLGHGENSIFDIRHELQDTFPDVTLHAVIADVRDAGRMREVLARFRPAVVFHAAAHKHVPLMEENPIEAVTNNVVGTLNVVNAAIEAGVQRFVLISTDKAVRPTSVMGASKRVAEQIVQRAALEHNRNFVSVRFGNVLGSRGSVVPTFLRQIRAGGPVTITHPEMRRFFMTIPEAVQLVLQAGAIGRGGEVFVLDMGEPVRIADLASDLISLCGLEVGQDIEIRYTGMRPGEKLFEETFFDEENARPSRHEKILYSRKAAPMDDLDTLVVELVAAAEAGRSPETLRAMLRRLVPDFSHESFGAPPTLPGPLADMEAARPVALDGVPGDALVRR